MNENRMMPIEDNSKENLDIKGLLFKYLCYWKLFAVSVILCLIVSFLYLRYATPIYNITSCIFVNIDEKKSPGGSNSLSTMEALGIMSLSNSFDNEIVKLQSRSLIQKVVENLEVYVEIFSPSGFGYSKPLYKDSPLMVHMNADAAKELKSPIRMEMEYETLGGLTVNVTYMSMGREVELTKTFKQLPAALNTPIGEITITPTKMMTDELSKFILEATINNPEGVARRYKGQMTVSAYSKTTTFANVAVKNSLPERGKDFIVQLINEYNSDANNEKNEVAQKTADFIQERIHIINMELCATETTLAEFKERFGLTNMNSDAQMALQENSRYKQRETENETQIGLVQLLHEYINSPDNEGEIIPANIGVNNTNLTAVIDEYNELVTEKKGLLQTSSENNPAIIRMNASIRAKQKTVQTTIASVLEALKVVQKDIRKQSDKFETKISNVPRQEKEFMGISRQQEIQAALYTMLLKKREENAIKLASTALNGRILENPIAEGPVSPKNSLFFLVALTLGMAIPMGSIFLIDLLHNKIEGRKDVEGLTSLTIIGEIPLSKAEPVQGKIVLRENRNDLMEETFRRLRTNLLFMLEKEEKVVLFTSTIKGEGKSFLVGNLGLSMAYLGKKVLVVGLDIRKPGLNRVFKLSSHNKGITDYLLNSDEVNLQEMIQHTDLSPNLDVLVGGTIPPNPTELLARESLGKAMDILKKKYDYILLDSAPIAMVTDTVVISQLADLCVYVCRTDLTPKDDFCYVNELNNEKNFKKLTVVLNGVDLSKNKYGKYGYHKYGYGKYGYGESYSYGYENK